VKQQPPSPDDLFPFVASVRVRSYELDSFGHVNNSVYLNYLEEARSEYLRTVGLSFNDFVPHGVHLVIVESHVKYITPSRYGDEIRIAGRFRDVTPVSLTIDYRLTDPTTGRVIATAWTRGAFVNAQTGRPTRAPAPFREAFLRAAAASEAAPGTPLRPHASDSPSPAGYPLGAGEGVGG
jgi:acyl-CoA thioester hydrolase